MTEYYKNYLFRENFGNTGRIIAKPHDAPYDPTANAVPGLECSQYYPCEENPWGKPGFKICPLEGSDNLSYGEWGYCEEAQTTTSDSTSLDVCKAVSGPESHASATNEKCIFPFRHGGTRYDDCNNNYFGSGPGLCVTSGIPKPGELDSPGVFTGQPWGYCPTTPCTPAGSSTTDTQTTTAQTADATAAQTADATATQTADATAAQTTTLDSTSLNVCKAVRSPHDSAVNKNCIFPFTHGGITYNNCGDGPHGTANFPGAPGLCVTSGIKEERREFTGASDQKWGYCSSGSCTPYVPCTCCSDPRATNWTPGDFGTGCSECCEYKKDECFPEKAGPGGSVCITTDEAGTPRERWCVEGDECIFPMIATPNNMADIWYGLPNDPEYPDQDLGVCVTCGVHLAGGEYRRRIMRKCLNDDGEEMEFHSNPTQFTEAGVNSGKQKWGTRNPKCLWPNFSCPEYNELAIPGGFENRNERVWTEDERNLMHGLWKRYEAIGASDDTPSEQRNLCQGVADRYRLAFDVADAQVAEQVAEQQRIREEQEALLPVQQKIEIASNICDTNQEECDCYEAG